MTDYSEESKQKCILHEVLKGCCMIVTKLVPILIKEYTKCSHILTAIYLTLFDAVVSLYSAFLQAAHIYFQHLYLVAKTRLLL